MKLVEFFFIFDVVGVCVCVCVFFVSHHLSITAEDKPAFIVRFDPTKHYFYGLHFFFCDHIPYASPLTELCPQTNTQQTDGVGAQMQ